MKKAVLILLCALLVVQVGCGKTETKDAESFNPTSDKIGTCYYEKSLMDSYEGVQNLCVYDGGLFCTAKDGDSYSLYAGEKVIAPYAAYFTVCGDTIWAIYGELFTDDVSGETREKAVLKKMDASGNVLLSIPVDPEIFGVQSRSIYGISADGENNVYLLYDGEIVVLNSGGNYACGISFDSSVNGIAAGSDGRVYAMTEDADGSKIYAISSDGEKAEVYTGVSRELMIFDGSLDHTLLIFDGDRLLSFVGTKKPLAVLIDFSESFIDFAYPTKFAAADDGTYYCIDDEKLYKLAPNSNKASKKVITYAAAGQPNLAAAIIDFNNRSDEYYIETLDYLQNGDTRGDAERRFALDIAAGNYPDLIDLEVFSLKESYSQKGLLVDLLPLMKKDSAFDEGDFMLMNILEREGSIFYFPAGYSIFTCGIDQRLMGDKKGWTYDEFEAFCRSDGTVNSTKENFLSGCMTELASKLVNKGDESCSFDSPEFVSCLEAVNMLNDTAPEPKLFPVFIFSPQSLRSLEMEMGMELSFVGWPTQDGSCGSYLYLSGNVGICSKSDNIDGAWEFIKFIYEYSNSGKYDSLPLKKSSYKEYIRGLLNPMKKFEGMEIVIAENGGFYADGQFYDYAYNDSPVVTQKQLEKFETLLKQIDTVYDYDASIDSIVQEEASAFFAGERSAEDAAEIIQSRVSLYLAEQG